MAVPDTPENNDLTNSVMNAINDAEQNAEQEAAQEAEKASEYKAYQDVCNEPPPPCLKGHDLDEWNLNKALNCQQMRQDFADKWYGGAMDAGHQQYMNQLARQIINIAIRMFMNDY